jgi:hypothetical protein
MSTTSRLQRCVVKFLEAANLLRARLRVDLPRLLPALRRRRSSPAPTTISRRFFSAASHASLSPSVRSACTALCLENILGMPLLSPHNVSEDLADEHRRRHIFFTRPAGNPFIYLGCQPYGQPVKPRAEPFFQRHLRHLRDVSETSFSSGRRTNKMSPPPLSHNSLRLFSGSWPHWGGGG